MRINQYIHVLVLLGAVSCGPKESTDKQGGESEPNVESTVAGDSSELQDGGAKEDTKPEVRYYLLSEQ